MKKKISILGGSGHVGMPLGLKFAQKGFDVVQMVKSNQGKRSIIQKFSSSLFYFIFSKISNINISSNVSDFISVKSKSTTSGKLSFFMYYTINQ